MSEKNKKYQVNIRSGIGIEESDPNKNIKPDKYKNFNKVYKSYSDSIYKRAWHRVQFHEPKNRKIALYIILILIVAALIILEMAKE